MKLFPREKQLLLIFKIQSPLLNKILTTFSSQKYQAEIVNSNYDVNHVKQTLFLRRGGRIMKRFWSFYLLWLALFLTIVGGRALAVSPPQVGGALPDFDLAVPKDAAEKNYLGLSRGLPLFGKETFKIQQIKADVVILEIFSMYCPHCQAEAPRVNDLYAKIDKNPSLRGKIKIIGIGIGNNVYEVGTFKKKYKIPFPLFTDEDFSLHKKFGEVRTPYFIVIRNYPKGSYRIVYSQLGAFGEVDQFLSQVIKLTGIK